MSVLLMLLQALVILLLAPFVNGVIKNLKGRLQSRRGPGIFQVYRDLFKYLKKDSVVSPATSWVFTLAPFVYFAGAVGAAALVPTVLTGDGLFHFGNLFALCYLLALGRFFLAIASLDAGSTFGGMGGSREMFLSVLVEPVMMITLSVVAFQAHSTDAAVIARSAAASGVTISGILAAIAFMILTIAETGRIPVDNPDTHLELTMFHEAMTLEYSGRHVALIFWASAIKQLVYILLMVNLFLPWGPAGLISMIVKALVVAVALAAIETGTNKMRLFRLPAFLMFTGLLALMAVIAL